jgi:hypothetical protein
MNLHREILTDSPSHLRDRLDAKAVTHFRVASFETV